MGTKKVEIEFVTKNGKSEWEISHGWWNSGGPGNYPVIKLGKDDGPDLITFTIDKDNPDIKFSSNDPIWVQADSKPLKYAMDSQICCAKVLNDGKKLVILDWNDKQVDLHYRLNFEGTTPPLDPIIRNGGGEGFYFDVAGTLLLTGLVAFTLGMAFHRRFFARS